MSSCLAASSAQLASLCSCTSVAGDPILLLGSFLLGCIAGSLLGVSYLRWADIRERSRFGDYVFKRYEGGKVTDILPMTAEQRAAVDKVFANADKMFDEVFTRTP